MISIQLFVFNPFQENTYVLFDETKECIIIDPGCYEDFEKQEIAAFISTNQLKPVKLLNTHCHIDHILGNNFISGKYNLKLEIHKSDLPVLRSAPIVGPMYGINVEPSPDPEIFLKEGDKVKFGSSEVEILFTPGHSPGSIAFYNKDENFAVSGDVLFQQSIGRTDLPGGDFNTLIKSIKEKLFLLDDKMNIFPGHGHQTTIGFEKKHNPFLN